jgi:hypothetical protein
MRFMNILDAQREMRSVPLGGWPADVLLIIFAFAGRRLVLSEEK